MSKQERAAQLPQLDSSFIDQFGEIDLEVYEAARLVWPIAERLADRILFDGHLGIELMFKAASKVTAAQKAGTKVVNLKYYLLKSYKHLLLADLEKENGRRRILSEHVDAVTPASPDAEAELHRKILINQLRLEMDDWMREVFDHLRLGYSFEELAGHYGVGANVLRSKFSKKLARLKKKYLFLDPS
jgi:hypothetical protein